MKRILIVSPFVPYPPDRGHRIRIYWLMRQLALEYRIGLVTQWFVASERQAVDGLRRAFPELDPVVAVGSPAHRSDFHRAAFSAVSRAALVAGYPRERVYHSSRTLREAVQHAVLSWAPDLVQCEYWFSRWSCGGGPAVAPWVDSIDLHWRRAERAANRASATFSAAILRRHARAIRLHELGVYRTASRVLAVHEEEATLLRPLISPVPVDTVPIASEVPIDPVMRDPANVILFLGALDYNPNRDALLFLVDQVMPQVRHAVPDATVLVVGVSPSSARLPQRSWIRYTGHVAELDHVVRNVAVAVAPIRLGSGTSVKVLTVLGLGLPLVASGRAVEGLALQPGVHYLKADDADDTAGAVVRLLVDRSLSGTVGRAGHGTALDQFDWRRTAPHVLRVYEAGLGLT